MISVRPAAETVSDAEDRWPASVRVSWFCLVVVFGGLIDLMLDIAHLNIPIQAIARIFLLASAVPTLIILRKDRRDLAPTSVRLASILIFYTAVISFVKDSFTSTSLSDSASDLVFMYGVGSILILAAVVPLSARFGRIFLLLTGASIGFGLFQLVTQTLNLPSSYLESIGLLYENFVNDRLRIVSFFRSAPRFAEFLAIISLVTLNEILRPSSQKSAQKGGALLAIYILIVVLLFNTYSRAGYILFLSSTIILLLFRRGSVRGGRGYGSLTSFLILFTAVASISLIALDKLPFDRSILDTTSYRSRQATWSMLSDQIGAGSFLDLLFGYGDTARFTRGNFGYYVIDNLNFALVLYGGVIGLAATVIMTGAVVRYAAAVRRLGALRLEPWIAYLTCLWLEGLFVDNHNTLFIAMIAMLGVVSSAKRMHNAEQEKARQSDHPPN